MPAPGVAYRGFEADEVPLCKPALTVKSESHDTWRTERSGHVVKEHRLPRRAKFVPTDGDCPVGINQLDDYRKTIIHRNGVTHEVLVDSLWELSEREQHAIASDVPLLFPGKPNRGVRAIADHCVLRQIFSPGYALKPNGVQMLKRSAICSRISRRTPIAHTVIERRWRMSSFAARVVLLRMMW